MRFATLSSTIMLGMNETRIASALLTYLASGGTLGRAVTELPAFKADIESAFEWMKSNAQCSAEEIQERADRLGELMRKKEQAIRNQDFDLAVDIRDQKCTLVKSFGLRAKGKDWNSVMEVEYQMRCLSALLMKSDDLDAN